MGLAALWQDAAPYIVLWTQARIACMQTAHTTVLWCACRTIIAQDLLQMYDALKLRAPTMSLDSFVKALADASWHNNLQQVCQQS
jgi:hypothetical protein